MSSRRPTHLATVSHGPNLFLTWTPPLDAIAGYNVYRATDPSGPFTRLNSSLITRPSYTDSNAAAAHFTYMVRAVKLEASASGTYYNPSEGAFAIPGHPAIDVAGSKPAARAPEHPIGATTVKSVAGGKLSPTGTGNGTGSADTIWFDDALPASAIPSAVGGDGWNWITGNPSPFSGSAAHQSNIAAGLHQHDFDWAYQDQFTVNTGDVLFAYVYLDPNNLPTEVMLQWNDGTWEHRAYWGANDVTYGTDGTTGRHYMGALPAAGQWVRLQVPASQVALEGSTLKGMAFTLYNGRATWDYVGKSTGITNSPGGDPGAGTNADDAVWIEDALPPGAIPSADGGDAWNWISANPAPFSGSLAHQSSIGSGVHQQIFNWAYGGSLAINAGDVLFTYVYLDPANLPAEIMLQWFDTSWEHRAYWGANSISFGNDGTISRHYMGPLPASGQWVRLEVPASAVGLEGSTVLGMCFTEFNGRAAWDHTGKSTTLSGSGSTGSGSNPPPVIDTNSPPSVVGSNTPPVVSTNQTPTTTNTPPAASNFPTNTVPGTSLLDDLSLQFPTPGMNGLHVLTPTMLELKLISTKAPDPAQVAQWNFVNSFSFAPPALNSFTVTANGQTLGVQAVGFKRRPLYAPLVGYDLRIENSLYLQLARPISDNQVVEVTNPDGCSLVGANDIHRHRRPAALQPGHPRQPGRLHAQLLQEGHGRLLPRQPGRNDRSRPPPASSSSTPTTGARSSRARSCSAPTSAGPIPRPRISRSMRPISRPSTPRANTGSSCPAWARSLPFSINDGVAMDFARAYALGLYHQRCGTSTALPLYPLHP